VGQERSLRNMQIQNKKSVKKVKCTFNVLLEEMNHPHHGFETVLEVYKTFICKKPAKICND